jgi:hypothetical protein
MSLDLTALDELARQIDEFKRITLGKLVERGAEILREEVPKATHRLEAGVSSDVDYEKLTGEIVVSAESDRRGARTATLHLKDGKTRAVTLRPTKAYNYAEVVARGNKSATLYPNKAKAFLIPVSSAPATGEYITDGDQIYIVRRSRSGMKANDFDERAIKRLGDEAVGITTAIAQEFFQ